MNAAASKLTQLTTVVPGNLSGNITLSGPTCWCSAVLADMLLLLHLWHAAKRLHTLLVQGWGMAPHGPIRPWYVCVADIVNKASAQGWTVLHSEGHLEPHPFTQAESLHYAPSRGPKSTEPALRVGDDTLLRGLRGSASCMQQVHAWSCADVRLWLYTDHRHCACSNTASYTTPMPLSSA